MSSNEVRYTGYLFESRNRASNPVICNFLLEDQEAIASDSVKCDMFFTKNSSRSGPRYFGFFENAHLCPSATKQDDRNFKKYTPPKF